MTEDIDMQDTAVAAPSVFRSVVAPVNDNPVMIRVESRVEKKQRELDGWKLELENSRVDCEEVSQRYQEIAKLARDAVKALASVDPALNPGEQQAGVAEVNRRKKAVMEELQAVKEAVILAQCFVTDFTAELANLSEASVCDDVWQYDKSATSASSRSKSGLYACTPDTNNPWHADIVRCLKEKMVPLESGTGKIDFNGLVPKVFTNAPSLDDIVKKKEGESSALLIVQGIHRFLSEFQEFHETHLGRLFPILASGYMAAAFKDAGLQTSLLKDPLVSWGSDLPTQLDKLEPEGDDLEYNYGMIDTWIPVKMVVQELFKLDLLKAVAIRGLFNLATSTFTDVHAYCTKVELLVEASGLRGTVHEKLVVESLYAGLPDEGQRAVITLWPEVTKVPGVDAVLECVRNARVAFPGVRTNWVDWFHMRFKTLSNKKSGAKAVERDDVPDSRSQKKRPRKDHAPAVKDLDGKPRKNACTTTHCNSKFHTPATCFTMHPELRNAPKRLKSQSSGPVRATASMRLEPIADAKIAAMKASMHQMRKSTVADRLEDDMNSLSFNTVSAFSQ